MSRQTEMAELTRIITCQQRLEYLKALLAKGEKRTWDRRRAEWYTIFSTANQQIEAFNQSEQQPQQAELKPNVTDSQKPQEVA